MVQQKLDLQEAPAIKVMVTGAEAEIDQDVIQQGQYKRATP